MWWRIPLILARGKTWRISALFQNEDLGLISLPTPGEEPWSAGALAGGKVNTEWVVEADSSEISATIT